MAGESEINSIRKRLQVLPENFIDESNMAVHFFDFRAQFCVIRKYLSETGEGSDDLNIDVYSAFASQHA